jgi:hypothetical protein
MIRYRRPSDLPHEYRQALYGHELCRRAGVPARDLYVGIQDGKLFVKAVRGDHYYAFIVAPTTLTDDELAATWPDAVVLWNETCNSDSGWDYEGSDIRAVQVMIAGELLASGVIGPRSN